MLVREADLTRRFARYTDDELTQVLVAGPALYTYGELVAAEKELSRRPPPPPPPPPAPRDTPLWPPQPEPLAPGQARPMSAYTSIDLLVDALLCGFLVWGGMKLWDWTVASMGWAWGSFAAFYFLTSALFSSLVALRQKWRARGRD